MPMYEKQRKALSRPASRMPSVLMLQQCRLSARMNSGATEAICSNTALLLVNRGIANDRMAAPKALLMTAMTRPHRKRALAMRQACEGVPMLGGRKACATEPMVSPKEPESMASAAHVLSSVCGGAAQCCAVAHTIAVNLGLFMQAQTRAT